MQIPINSFPVWRLAALLCCALVGLVSAAQAAHWFELPRFYDEVTRVSADGGVIALLCYGVENAKTVRISPTVQGVYPSPNHCIEIVPERTTHYTILAEGFDGSNATQSFTLPVQPPMFKPRQVQYAEILYRNERTRSATSATVDSVI